MTKKINNQRHYITVLYDTDNSNIECEDDEENKNTVLVIDD